MYVSEESPIIRLHIWQGCYNLVISSDWVEHQKGGFPREIEKIVNMQLK